MKSYDFNEFMDFYFKCNLYGGADSVNFQLGGWSNEIVRKYWRKACKLYNLPRAKRIESAVIYFN